MILSGKSGKLLLFPFEFGVLPSELEKAMLTGDIKSIVGADIFKFFTLTFSHDKNKI